MVEDKQRHKKLILLNKAQFQPLNWFQQLEAILNWLEYKKHQLLKLNHLLTEE